MNIQYTPTFTVPSESAPTIALPVFSDLVANPGHVAKLAGGAEQLANTALLFGAEAAALEGRKPEVIADAIAAGKLVVELAVRGIRPMPGTDHMPLPGIVAMGTTDALPTQDTDWHTLLAIDNTLLQISTHNQAGSSASATFELNKTGSYEPRHFSYGEQHGTGPYAGIGQTLALRGLVAYKRLLNEEGGAMPNTILKERFRGLTLLGLTAKDIRAQFNKKNLVTTAYVAAQSETFEPTPWWIQATK